MVLTMGSIILKPFTLSALIAFCIMLILLLFSALISGSEIAFFSLEPPQLKELEEKPIGTNKIVIDLLKKPQHLLSTILISNNFVNIGIVLTSTYFMDSIFDFSHSSEELSIFVNVVIVTFLLLLFGEIIPKIYATISPVRFASLMAYPMTIMSKVTSPLGAFLIATAGFLNKNLSNRSKTISVDDLSHVIDIAKESTKDEREMLESVVRFGNIDVKSIMCPRIDVVAVDISSGFQELWETIRESGFSRIPIYDSSFDNVKGMLYAKDLLTHLDNDDTYKWQDHLRDVYFVPESKKISDLLDDFQMKKLHIALVIDEYGGTSGIVTLEDVIEEIMGEIKDESDELEILYTKIDERTYSFEGKTLIHDFSKVVDVDDALFNELNADTLAGLVLDATEEIPKTGESFNILGFIFTVQESDNRRIKRLKITLP